MLGGLGLCIDFVVADGESIANGVEAAIRVVLHLESRRPFLSCRVGLGPLAFLSRPCGLLALANPASFLVDLLR